MVKEILPFQFKGRLQTPYSKSYLQRAVAIAALCNEPTTIIGYTPSNDAKVALEIIRELGGSFEIHDNEIKIYPIQVNANRTPKIFCGEAGLSTRMFTPIAAATYDGVEVNGDGSILTRPMDMVVDALEQLGAKVASNDNKLPLVIAGQLKGRTLEIDGAESSQLLTGLLIALPLLKEESRIEVLNLKSIPYVKMTLDILNEFGVEIENCNYQYFTIRGNQVPKLTSKYRVEGDWSGASFLIVGGAISGEIELTNLNEFSAQADRAILNAVELAGAIVEWEDNVLYVHKRELKAFEFDATQCPDLFPPLVALAACCEGVTKLIGTKRLTHKESNRAITLQEEFKKLGVKIELHDNEMLIFGGSEISAGTVSSRNDHRIAMATALMATQTNDVIRIENGEAINKSYPNFYSDLDKIVNS